MKKVLFFALLLVFSVYMISCTHKEDVEPSVAEPEISSPEVDIPEDYAYTGDKVAVDVNNGTEREAEKSIAYTNSNGNISNGAIALDCGEYLY